MNEAYLSQFKYFSSYCYYNVGAHSGGCTGGDGQAGRDHHGGGHPTHNLRGV